MSQENVELARAWNEAMNAGDMDAVRKFYDPDVVARPTKDWPEPGPFFGREAVMQWLEQLRDTWDTLLIETISRIDAGDRIIERQIPHGTGQGPAYEAEYTTITTIRKGKILYLEFFWDHAEALEAVGLSEQDAHADS
jgi:ketosteroid isomerase-like protein